MARFICPFIQSKNSLKKIKTYFTSYKSSICIKFRFSFISLQKREEKENMNELLSNRSSQRRYSTHKFIVRRVDSFQIVVKPFFDHWQIFIAPFRLFLYIFQRLLDDVVGTSEFALTLHIQRRDHVIAFLCGEHACCRTDQIVPQIRLVLKSAYQGTQ